MSEVRGVVVAHGSLARCLVETVESISGVEGALRPISNEGCSPELLMPVVSGVNLSMLLDFVFHRDMELTELSQRVVEKGRAGAIAHLPDLYP